MRRVIFLEKQTDVDLMRFLQCVQRATKNLVVVRHKTLAKRLERSESTIRRSIDRLVRQGHLLRAYVPRQGGGYLCVYRVRLDVTFRKASLLRMAKEKIEQARSSRKFASDAGFRASPAGGVKGIPKPIDNKRSARPSLPLEEKDDALLQGLLQTAKAVGIDDTQSGFLRLAALRYGVREAWRALQIAYEHGYRIADLVRVTWGILKRQYPEGVMT